MDKDKKLLFKKINEVLLNTHYISSVNGFSKTFMPHHIDAIEKSIFPIIEKFFDGIADEK